jgi:hypothetical protein
VIHTPGENNSPPRPEPRQDRHVKLSHRLTFMDLLRNGDPAQDAEEIRKAENTSEHR